MRRKWRSSHATRTGRRPKPDAKPREDPKNVIIIVPIAPSTGGARRSTTFIAWSLLNPKGSAAWSKAEEDKMLERLLQRNQSAWWEKPT